MKKGLTALVAVGAVAVTLTASMGSADAQRWHRHHHYHGGGGVAAGIIGGLAAGAIIAGATRPHYYEPAPVYGPGPYYAAPPRACVEPQYVWSPRRGDYVLRNVRVPC